MGYALTLDTLYKAWRKNRAIIGNTEDGFQVVRRDGTGAVHPTVHVFAGTQNDVRAQKILSPNVAFSLGYFLQKASGPKLARLAFPGQRRRHVSALSSVGSFVVNTCTAHICRSRGDIPAALVYEGIAQRIYDSLPPFAIDLAEEWEGSIFP